MLGAGARRSGVILCPDLSTCLGLGTGTRRSGVILRGSIIPCVRKVNVVKILYEDVP